MERNEKSFHNNFYFSSNEYYICIYMLTLRIDGGITSVKVDNLFILMSGVIYLDASR